MPIAPPASPNLKYSRLAVGMMQGGLLYGLYKAYEPARTWPATDGFAFAPILAIAWYVPLIALLALGAMRTRTLLAWSTAVAAALMSLAWHDVARRIGDPGILPSFTLMAASAPLIFIAHALAMAAEQDRRLIARYGTYFDVAWKLAVQLFFAAGFVALFWGMLWLGASLFKLIGLDFLDRLIKHKWFSIPATALALASAIHLTDVRVGIVRAIRTLKLLLMSWLLPLLVAMLLGFLGSLPFTGLDLLWRTGHATAVLLTAACLLIVLINAAYQDGEAEHAPVALLRHSARVGALLILPLVAIAAYAVHLRVGQYGWSTDRILAASTLVVLSLYAAGYAWGAARPGDWLRPLQATNLAAAVATIAVLLALLSPLADPARIAVADQVARLRSGLVPPDRFDFNYLHRDGKRYGEAALKSLAEDENAVIREQAGAALKGNGRPPALATPDTDEIAGNVTMHPKGAVLPQGFAAYWSATKPDWQMPDCLKRRNVHCDASLLDMDGDGNDEVLMIPEGTSPRAVAFKAGPDRSWSLLGTISGNALNCAGVLDTLRSDSSIKPVAPQLKDLEIAGQRLRLEVPSAKCAR